MYTGQLRSGFYLVLKYLKETNIKKKEYIALSPFTIFDMVNVVISAGYKPLFVDIETDNFCMSVKKFKEINLDSVAGCLFTHHHTNKNNYFEIKKICNDSKIVLIEDCATALGSKYYNSNEYVGKYGDFSLYSFGIYKIFNTICGGAVYSEKYHDELKSLYLKMNKFKMSIYFKKLLTYIFMKISLNIYVYNYFIFKTIKIGNKYGLNFINKLTKNDPLPKINENGDVYNNRINIIQLMFIKYKKVDYIPQLINHRNEVYYNYLNKFKDFANFIILPSYSKNSACHTFPVIIKKNRDYIYSELINNNIDVAKYYYRDCASLKIFDNYFMKKCENSKYISDNVILFPCYSNITKSYIEKIYIILKKIFN